MIRVGVVLSGCGVNDGAEIHESVLTLLALAEKGVQVICMAPDIEQHHVINHLTGQVENEKRNVLVESARIARGDIRDLAAVKTSELDALIFPGGFGAAKNLSTFAFDGAKCQIHEVVSRLVKQIHQEGKPLGAVCISPAVMARIFEGHSLQLTIGNDPAVAEAVRLLGHTHCECRVDEICVDQENKVVTTPAYMLAENVAQAYSGIKKLVVKVVEMAEQKIRA